MDVVKGLGEAKGREENRVNYHQEKPGETVKPCSLSQVCSSPSAFAKKLPIGSGEWNFLGLMTEFRILLSSIRKSRRDVVKIFFLTVPHPESHTVQCTRTGTYTNTNSWYCCILSCTVGSMFYKYASVGSLLKVNLNKYK